MKRALVSVSDKTGLINFLKPLVDQGLEVISTGGTLQFLIEAPTKLAPSTKPPKKSTCSSFASQNFASLRSAPLKLTLFKIVPVKSEYCKFAFIKKGADAQWNENSR